MDDRNQVTYQDPLIYEFPYLDSSLNCGIFDVNTIMGGFHLSDIDGDGINDMILPQRMYVGDSWNTENLYIILGKDIKNEKKVNYKAINPINPTTSSPLYASCDFDGDGKDEILCIETNPLDGFYRASTVKFDESKESIDSKSCNFEISGKPEKVFCGDYNNDGLNDIIVLHKNGYKIFYNLGSTETNVLFDTSISKAGTTMKDQIRIDQGDFNGDGLLDFVYNVNGESLIRIAYNNGNGTFNTVASYDINISPKIIDEQEDHFFLRAVDMDRDGSSEVLVCKAVYDIKSSKKVFKETQVRWLKLDGLKLKLNKSFTKTSEVDADEKLIFIGDFDGDGYIDLANVGSALDRQDATVYNKTINIYHTNGANASLGRVTSITDGLGNTSTVKYSYLTSPDVYSSEHHMDTDLRVIHLRSLSQ